MWPNVLCTCMQVPHQNNTCSNYMHKNYVSSICNARICYLFAYWGYASCIFYSYNIFLRKTSTSMSIKKVNSLAQLGTQIKLSQRFVSGMHIIEYMYLIEKGTCSH